ncbi:DinB family protein [Micromonospora sp. BRA006-A]|nr:DinB family protein [Micromonospora sp. BRA006-A]
MTDPTWNPLLREQLNGTDLPVARPPRRAQRRRIPLGAGPRLLERAAARRRRHPGDRFRDAAAGPAAVHHHRLAAGPRRRRRAGHAQRVALRPRAHRLRLVPLLPTAAGALAQLDEEYAAWTAGVEALGEEGLASPCGPAEGPFADVPMATLVLHINREVIHHLSEVCRCATCTATCQRQRDKYKTPCTSCLVGLAWRHD